MNLLVTGTRRSLSTEEKTHVENVIRTEVGNLPNLPRGQHLLIHGDAPGVDTFCADMLGTWGWEICAHPADWPQYGRAAGPIRNQNMLVHHKGAIDLVLGFPVPESKGTWDMLERAVKAHLTVRVYPL